MSSPFKAGDRIWRGYARHYGDETVWFPEIRPGEIASTNHDGTHRVNMEGVLPGYERKRSFGAWVTFDADPETLHRTPEEALAYAKRCSDYSNAEAASKAAEKQPEGQTCST